ncbi:MAG: hypothetical protein D6B27_00065 [Gammaproteobacteria bacterium]|nr:MAG: hypothetical protein D6B27_00065 [Gammaproteobacteria bacterium]
MKNCSLNKSHESLFQKELKKWLFPKETNEQYVYKSSFSDSAFGCLGLIAGADQKLSSIIARQIRRCFNKSWSQLTDTQWRIYKTVRPHSCKYLKRLIDSQINESIADILFSKDNGENSFIGKISQNIIVLICHNNNAIVDKYGKNSPILNVIESLEKGEAKEAVNNLLSAITAHGITTEVLCCFEQLDDELIFQLNAIDSLIENGSIISKGTESYRENLCALKTRLDMIEHDMMRQSQMT